ncbi:MAG: protein kinase, partial [Oligoflexia bacterium]|nr:protein kinase [Oligoflexia bacterium]
MLEPGTTVDRYVVEVFLDEGGMASVYRVRHGVLGTRHALKVLRHDSQQLRSRLLKEGRLQARLDHPHLVPVTDILDVLGRPALLMPYVDGPSLGAVLRQQRLTTDAAKQLFRGILAGVAHAHAHGVVHRDLKPANVLLESGASGVVPRVADFGIARVVEGDRAGTADPAWTRTHQFLGTYAAPEQVRGARDVDHRADIYSMGVILYELHCGQRPFNSQDILEMLDEMAAEKYSDPCIVSPELDQKIADAIRRCLRADPDERPQGCAALGALLYPDELPDPGGTWVSQSLRQDQIPLLAASLGPVSTPHLGAGDTLAHGRYALQDRLSGGLYCSVWKAYDTRAETTVAIKILHARWALDQRRVDGLFHSAAAMASLDHPAIPRVFLAEGRDGLHRFYVMEYLEGGSLLAARLEGGLDGAAATAAVLQAGDALVAAHARGLIHRNVEPGNIILGRGGHASLVDFDLITLDLTEPVSHVGGDFVYQAPEVHADPRAASPRSDLYGLAMCVAFALAGRMLPMDVVRDPEAFVAGLRCSAAAKHLLAAAMAADPGQRPDDLAAFLRELRRSFDNDRRSPPFVPSAERVRRRLRRRVALSTGIGVLAIVAAGAVGLGMRHAVDQRQEAEARRRVDHLASMGWSKVSTQPGVALAYLRAAVAANRQLDTPEPELLSREQAVALGMAGAGQQVVPMPDNVLVLQVSPDGQTLAAGLEDGSIILMDAETGQIQTTVTAIADRVYKVRWSPDGNLLAAWDTRPSADGETRAPAVVVDPNTGRVRYTLTQTGRVNEVSFSPDGHRVAVSGGSSITVWDTTTGVLEARLEGSEAAGDLTWLDEDLLVGGAPISVWSVSQATRLVDLPVDVERIGVGHQVLAPDGGTLLYMDRVGVRSWDVRKQKLLAQAPLPDPRWLSVSPSGSRLATFSRAPAVDLWTVPDLRSVAHLVNHKKRPMVVSFSEDGRVLTASLDRTARLWSARDGSPLAVLRGHKGAVHAAAWVGSTPVTGGLDATVRSWTQIEHAQVRIQAPLRDVSAWTISADGSKVAMGSAGGDLWAFDLDEDRPLAVSLDTSGRVDDLGFSPLSGELLALVNKNQLVAFPPAGEPSTLPLGRQDAGPDRGFAALGFLPGGLPFVWSKNWFQVPAAPVMPLRLVYRTATMQVMGDYLVGASQSDSRLGATDIGTGAGVWETELPFDDTIATLALAHDGRTLAVSSWDGDVALLDPVTGQVRAVASPHAKAVTTLAWVDRDRALLTGSGDGRSLLLDGADLSVLDLVHEGQQAIIDAEPSPDGRCIAIISRDGFLRLETLDTHRLSALHTIGEGALRAFRWSADSTTMVALTLDGQVLTWDGDCSVPAPDLVVETGGWTNLRLCPDQEEVVPVVP